MWKAMEKSVSAEWNQAVRGTHLLWLPIPAYAGMPILFWIMHARLWTFVLAITVCVVLSILKLKGRTVPWIVRRFKLWLRGGVVQARPVWYRRRMQSLSSFDLVDLKGN